MKNPVTLVYLIADSAIDKAFVLESFLVKHRRPRYNVVLRDDKSFLYLKITLNVPPFLVADDAPHCG